LPELTFSLPLAALGAAVGFGAVDVGKVIRGNQFWFFLGHFGLGKASREAELMLGSMLYFKTIIFQFREWGLVFCNKS
jgi:hypothetical protein